MGVRGQNSLQFPLILLAAFAVSLSAAELPQGEVTNVPLITAHPGMPLCETVAALYGWDPGADTWRCVEPLPEIVPTSAQLVMFLTAERNYWERLALTNAAESTMLQTTAGKQWLAHQEYLKTQSTNHTKALAVVNAACKTLGSAFIFIRKSLTCEQEESAALAVAGKPTGKK